MGYSGISWTYMYSPQDSISTTAVVEVIVAICLKSLLTPECYKLTRETRRFNIKLFPYKLHKNFVHFKYSLPVNKKNILGEYLCSLSEVRGTIYTSNE